MTRYGLSAGSFEILIGEGVGGDAIEKVTIARHQCVGVGACVIGAYCR